MCVCVCVCVCTQTTYKYIVTRGVLMYHHDIKKETKQKEIAPRFRGPGGHPEA